MPSYTIRGLPSGLLPRAKARATDDDTTLDLALVRMLTSYADGQTAGQLAAAGGRPARHG